MLCRLCPALVGDAVIFAPPADVRLAPSPFDVTKPLKTVEHGIEHSVGPFQPAAREVAHSLENGVAVRVAFGEDGQDKRCRGGGDKILVDIHGCCVVRVPEVIPRSNIHGTSMYVNCALGAKK